MTRALTHSITYMFNGLIRDTTQTVSTSTFALPSINLWDTRLLMQIKFNDRFPMFLAGKWVMETSNSPINVLDPSSEETLVTVPAATPADVQYACASAAEAFTKWRHTPGWERSRILREWANILRRDCETLGEVMTREQGKPLPQAIAEVRASADQFDWNADEARRIYGRVVDPQVSTDRIFILKEPVGPIAAFAPWNFPMLLGARKVSAALAAGCTVILVAPIEAPLSSLLMAKAGEEAGLPSGMLSVLTGDPAAIAGDLISAPQIRKISVTSSVSVGVAVMATAAQGVKPLTLELGGHAPVIVLPGGDVRAAARACALGKFRNAGQVCISASRFIVHETAVDDFVDEFTKTTLALKLGPGMDPDTDVGPLGSEKRLVAVQGLVDDALAMGAELLVGGTRSKNFKRGFFYEPTVLVGVGPGMRVLSEEPFGPVAPIQSFSTIDEALAMANSTDFGLAGFVFTDELETGLRIAERMDVGMVGINNLTIATAEAPFGGVKKSGFGREGGTEGIEEFLVTRYINARMPVTELWEQP